MLWVASFGVPDDDKAAQPRADIKTVQAASPEPHIKQLQQYAQLFSGETSIPVSSLGVSGMANPTSAESYIASREDLIATAEVTMDVWGVAWARTMARLVALAQGVDAPPDERWASIIPMWRPPQHQSRAAMVDAGAKQLGAVPWLACPGSDHRALAEREKTQAVLALGDLLAAPVEDVAVDGAAASS